MYVDGGMTEVNLQTGCRDCIVKVEIGVFLFIREDEWDS